MKNWQQRLDRILGVTMRLSFVAIIVAMCLNVSTIYAQCLPIEGTDWRLMTTVLDNDTGEAKTVSDMVAQSEQFCTFAMGVTADTWINAGFDVNEQFTMLEGGYYVKLETAEVTVLITCTQEPVESQSSL